MGRTYTLRELLITTGLATWVAAIADMAIAMARAVPVIPYPAVIAGSGGGIFGNSAADADSQGVLLGLAAHVVIIAFLALFFVLSARKFPALLKRPVLWGIVYALAIVILRPLHGEPAGTKDIVLTSLAHILCVGLPIALITARFMGPERASSTSDLKSRFQALYTKAPRPPEGDGKA